MKPETPNERNYRLLRERFLKKERIVYSDGNGNEYTLPELRKLTIKTNSEYSYHTKYLIGNESALHMLKSQSNILKDEVEDVIYDIEKQRIYHRIKEFVDAGHQMVVVNYPEQDYCKLYVHKENKSFQIYGNEKMKLIKNENGTPIEIQFENGHSIQFEHENEPDDEYYIPYVKVGFINENETAFGNENGNENEPENGNGNGLLNKIKNIL